MNALRAFGQGDVRPIASSFDFSEPERLLFFTDLESQLDLHQIATRLYSHRLLKNRRFAEKIEQPPPRRWLSSTSAFWTASSFFADRVRSCDRLFWHYQLCVESDRSFLVGGLPGSWAGRIVTIGGMRCILAWSRTRDVLGGAASVSPPKIPKNHRRPDRDDSRRRSFHGVVALAGDVFAQDGFEVHAVGDGHRVDDELAGQVSSADWRFEDGDDVGVDGPQVGRRRTTSASSRVVVILVSASPNRLGTILLISIFSSFSAALARSSRCPGRSAAGVSAGGRRRRFRIGGSARRGPGAGPPSRRRRARRFVPAACGGEPHWRWPAPSSRAASSSSSSRFRLVEHADQTQERVVRIERPQGVERTVADFDRGLVHQLAQLQMRRGLVQGRQGRQGVGPKFLVARWRSRREHPRPRCR